MNVNLYIAKFISKLQKPAMRNCHINKTSRVYEKSELQNVELGKHSYIGKSSVISDAKIGNFCSIAGYGQIGGGRHPINMVSTSPCFLAGHSATGNNLASIQYKSSTTVEIGNDVWIGAGCYIKAGVKIGDGAIVGAHSVVTHDVGSYEIAVGNPAKVIRKRFDDETIDKLIQLQWWNWPDDKIEKYGEAFETPAKLIGKIDGERK